MKTRCEFASERSELLLRNFRESIARQSVISARKAFSDAINMPAPRFWVSEARATRIIRMMMKGEDVLSGMHTKKREMYMEIYRRVKAMKVRNPDMALGDIVFEVVNSEAPESYLTIGYAGKLIGKVKGVFRPLKKY